MYDIPHHLVDSFLLRPIQLKKRSSWAAGWRFKLGRAVAEFVLWLSRTHPRRMLCVARIG